MRNKQKCLFLNGCGGRIRTCDLRVMSPTSYQLLYPAKSWCRRPGSNRHGITPTGF